jgi:hypothetical protein
MTVKIKKKMPINLNKVQKVTRGKGMGRQGMGISSLLTRSETRHTRHLGTATGNAGPT